MTHNLPRYLDFSIIRSLIRIRDVILQLPNLCISFLNLVTTSTCRVTSNDHLPDP